MANICCILTTLLLAIVPKVLSIPITGTMGMTEFTDVASSVIESGIDFGFTTPSSSLNTEGDIDEADDDIVTSSQTVVSGVVVEEGIDESKVEVLKANLEKYGYVPQGSTLGQANINYTSAIMAYQQNAGINQTGILDFKTLELLNTSRCGFPDVMPYVTSSVTWPRNGPVTYSFGALTNDLNRDVVKNEMRRAFQVWDEVSGLTFSEVADGPSVDIRIKFGSFEHGDGISFDGRGGVLAHAFLPRNGDAHFDDSETWTIGTRSGTNLFQVAAHEFGHSLGLYHSDVQSALMYPYYRGYIPNFSLDSDDIAGIRSLYGRNTGRPTTTTRRPTTQRTTTRQTTTTTTTTPTGPTPPRQACTGSFDAVLKDYNGRIYALTGPYYWRLDQTSASWGEVQNRFGFNLPDNVDASFQSGIFSYFFSECYYYYQTSTRRYFPRIPINRSWVGLPCDIDAAYRSARYGATFFFKDGFVYKYSTENELRRRARIYNIFGNVPSALRDGVEAVVSVDNIYVHFYRDGRYYRMRDADKQFVNFPNGLPYRDVKNTLTPQCRGLSLIEETEHCSNSS